MKRAARLSRREVARRLIDGASSPIGRLAEEHAGRGRCAFDRETAPASLAALDESLKSATKPGDSSLSETDWEPVLVRALQPGSSLGRSDGRGASDGWTAQRTG